MDESIDATITDDFVVIDNIPKYETELSIESEVVIPNDDKSIIEKFLSIIEFICNFWLKTLKWIDDNKDAILKYSFLIIIFIIGIIMRIKLIPKMSGDMNSFLVHWYRFIKENGGFAAVGKKIGDYSPMYYYFLALMSYTNLPTNISIKLISIVFDVVMTIYVTLIIAKKYGRKTYYTAIAFAVTWCLPTVVLNSAAWGQCDVIYTCFLVMALYYILTGHDRIAMIMIGISFSFKLQAIFIAPLIGVLLFRKKIRWRTVIWIPLVYLISIVPAGLIGGEWKRLLTTYIAQTGSYQQLTLSMANIWSLFGISFKNNELGAAGTYFGGFVMLTMIFYYVMNKRLKITDKTIVAIAMLGSFILPFVLPHMHERYMYFTEIMFVIFAFFYRDKVWIILTSQYFSVSCLLKFLYGITYMDMRMLALIGIINVIVVYYTLQKEIIVSINEDEIVMKFEIEPKKNDDFILYD